MYQTSYFTEQDKASVTGFMKAHPFVLLTGNQANRSVATQVPVLIAERDGALWLRGHVMKHTDHHKAFLENAQVLVLFTGPQCYVSASWYNERGTASTWNYMTVHARGHITFLDAPGTIDILTDMTHHFEQGQAAPEMVEHMQHSYVQTHVQAIAGFELKLEDIYPVFKLSQNKDDESYKTIVEKLQASDNTDEKKIAAEMIQRRAGLFT